MRKLRMWPAQLVIFVVRENDGTARPMTDVEGRKFSAKLLSVTGGRLRRSNRSVGSGFRRDMNEGAWQLPSPHAQWDHAPHMTGSATWSIGPHQASRPSGSKSTPIVRAPPMRLCAARRSPLRTQLMVDLPRQVPIIVAIGTGIFVGLVGYLAYVLFSILATA
jgi:hypothetical protein